MKLYRYRDILKKKTAFIFPVEPQSTLFSHPYDAVLVVPVPVAVVQLYPDGLGHPLPGQDEGPRHPALADRAVVVGDVVGVVVPGRERLI